MIPQPRRADRNLSRQMEIFLRWLISGVLFILIANFASAAPPNWKTTKIEEREFVALNEVAAALGMKRSEKRADPLEIGFESDAHSLIVKLGSRQAIIDGVRHWFSFPIPKEEGKKGRLYISLIDLKSTVIPALTLKIEGLGPVKTVVFDPGHGGHDPGAIGAFGKEKDYALDIVKRTRRILEGRGIKVVQSRLSDFYVKLSDRPAMTKNYDDPIFVSIHLNGSTNRNASGFEIFAFTPSGAPATGRAPSPKGDAEIESATPNEPSHRQSRSLRPRGETSAIFGPPHRESSRDFDRRRLSDESRGNQTDQHRRVARKLRDGAS
jgi:N-acetylmuramoyl-L-alanine amidase